VSNRSKAQYDELRADPRGDPRNLALRSNSRSLSKSTPVAPQQLSETLRLQSHYQIELEHSFRNNSSISNNEKIHLKMLQIIRI